LNGVLVWYVLQLINEELQDLGILSTYVLGNPLLSTHLVSYCSQTKS